MLLGTNQLREFEVAFSDLSGGKIVNIYYDALFWNVHYLVTCLPHVSQEKVYCISHSVLDKPDPIERLLPIQLSLKQDTHQSIVFSTSDPVEEKSKKKDYEIKYPLIEFMITSPDMLQSANGAGDALLKKLERFQTMSPKLRSQNTICNYRVESKNGKLGNISEFIIESDTWTIQYLVVNTEGIKHSRKKVLVSPGWIKRINWTKSLITFDLEQNIIMQSPEYREGMQINSDFELQLVKYFARQRL